MPENSPAPGWYPAPHANNEQRYWDGAQWLDSEPAGTTTKPKKLNMLALVAMIIAVVGFIFACIPGALVVGWILLPIAFVLSIVSLFLKGDKKWFGIVGLIVSIVGTIVAVIVFFAVVATAIDESFGDSDIAVTQPSQEPSADDAADDDQSVSDEVSFVDNVLTLPDATIKITETKTIAVGQPGNEYGDKPVIAFWYEVTNVSGAKIDPTTAWIGAFRAYQDNDPNSVNELNIASLPDTQFLDSQLEEIKQGGTVANAVAYELDDETTPVELAASDDFWMNEIGRASFPVN